MTLRRVHVFESRSTAFKDADVLQENVIFRAVKGKPAGKAVVSSSANAEDPDIYAREVSPDEMVNPNDPDLVIHVVPDEIGPRFAERVNGFAATLDDLGIQVSTGRVVDFRAKDALAFQANGKTVPLVYPVHWRRLHRLAQAWQEAELSGSLAQHGEAACAGRRLCPGQAVLGEGGEAARYGGRL